MPAIGLPELVNLLPFLVIGPGIYWLPLMIAVRRGTGNKLAVFLVTLLTGWTVIGWIAAQIMASRRSERLDEAGGERLARAPRTARELKPCWRWGIRMPSRNRSQLSFDSWMATIVQPPADGPAAWKVWPSGRRSLPRRTAASVASYCS
jgi:hypothetical protein